MVLNKTTAATTRHIIDRMKVFNQKNGEEDDEIHQAGMEITVKPNGQCSLKRTEAVTELTDILKDLRSHPEVTLVMKAAPRAKLLYTREHPLQMEYDNLSAEDQETLDRFCLRSGLISEYLAALMDNKLAPSEEGHRRMQLAKAEERESEMAQGRTTTANILRLEILMAQAKGLAQALSNKMSNGELMHQFADDQRTTAAAIEGRSETIAQMLEAALNVTMQIGLDEDDDNDEDDQE